MNKGVIVGIIVGVAVAIGIASSMAFMGESEQPNVVSSETEIAPEEITLEEPVDEEPAESPGRALSIELEERMGIKANP